MNHFQVNPIGTIHHSEEGPCIRVDNAYIPALKALEGFSHINVIWHFTGTGLSQISFHGKCLLSHYALAFSVITVWILAMFLRTSLILDVLSS